MEIDDLKKAHAALTDRALPEEDTDKFIECLLERGPYSMDLINHRVRLDEQEAAEMLEKELKILEKLKEERARLLNEMDQLSKTRKAVRGYSPAFPFPSMPIYFDSTE